MQTANNDFQNQQPQHKDVITGNNDILLNNFQIKKKRYRVLLNVDHIAWERLNAKSKEQQQENNKLAESVTAEHATYGKHSQVLHINEIVNVGKGRTKSASKKPIPITTATTSANVAPTECYLSIHYAERLLRSSSDCNRWRMRRLTLYSADPYVVRQWHETLCKHLQTGNEQRMRMRRLLVFINPFGGKKQGLKVYEQHCKSLFQLANIDASCIISQRANQIRDILLTHDLTLYDAVCCVGGDGTVAEVINGLLFRSIRDNGLDLARPTHVPKPALPVGVIPAGSTDTIAYSLHGTSDAQTAAIHVVLGQRRGLDVCSVRNRQGLLRFCTSVLSYGYLGDVAVKSEQYRWMGTKRYEFVGVKAFLSNRGYEALISLPHTLVTDAIEPNGGCTLDCKTCNKKSDVHDLSTVNDNDEVERNNCDKESCNTIATINSSTEQQWKEIRGKFFMISGTNISCKCTRSPNGISPTNHLGDGYLQLILVQKTSLLNNVRFLLQSIKKNGDISKLPFVEVHRTKMFQFQLPNAQSALENQSICGSCQPIVNNCSNQNASTEILPSHTVSSWNCDGEVVTDLDITMISHCQLIDVFMRGPYVHKHSASNGLKRLCVCCNAEQ